MENYQVCQIQSKEKIVRVPVSSKNQALRKIGFARVGDNYHGTLYGKSKILKSKMKLKDNGFVFERNLGEGFADEVTAIYTHPEHPSIEIHVPCYYHGMHVEPAKGYTYCTM